MKGTRVSLNELIESYKKNKGYYLETLSEIQMSTLDNYKHETNHDKDYQLAPDCRLSAICYLSKEIFQEAEKNFTRMKNSYTSKLNNRDYNKYYNKFKNLHKIFIQYEKLLKKKKRQKFIKSFFSKENLLNICQDLFTIFILSSIIILFICLFIFICNCIYIYLH